MKKILETGGTGFLGKHLNEHLLKGDVKPENVRIFARLENKLQKMPVKNLDLVVRDIRNRKDVAKAVKDIDVTYHLASKTGEEENKKRKS